MAKWVSSSALFGAPDLVAKLGGDWATLPAAVGLEISESLEPTKLIEVAALTRFLALAAEQLECQSFGLMLSQYQGFSVLGSLALLLESADTIGESLQDLATYFPVFTMGALIALVETKGGIEVNYELAAGTGLPHRQITELGFGILVKEMRRHIPGWEPEYITFRHAPPDNGFYHRQYLGKTIHYNADRNSIFIKRADLEKPTCVRSTEVHCELAAQYSDLRDATLGTVTAAVETIVRAFMAHETVNLSKAATLLGMSRRTLQRKLAEDGTSLAEIIDAVRADLALSYLQESHLKVTEIAEILQFSETSALSRAVVRWYGHSPRSIKGGVAVTLDATHLKAERKRGSENWRTKSSLRS
jgi:AraC-like DNA-binding protein